jgi:hypothetical protein
MTLHYVLQNTANSLPYLTRSAAQRLYLLSGAGSGRVIAATGGAGGALEPTRYHTLTGHHPHSRC